MVKSGRGQDYVSRKINWSSHNSAKIKSAFDVSRKRSKNKTEQEQEEALSCHGHVILSKMIESIIKVTVHDELNASFSFHGKLFWKITVHCF